ncbi:hypothetical protein AB2B38_001430 [Balneola sp. MJW-20]|uniref:hypothetical protein n=1 Tax=Gracilimonas aurantiaca TaxID=3234185 RepID=UPI003467664E
MRTQSISLILLFITSLLFTACGGFVVDKVNYAHQLETVLTPDQDGEVYDQRHGISFNVTPFEEEEWGVETDSEVSEIRLIRDNDGYYFITSPGFKHVYVMAPDKGKLKLKNKLKVSEEGLKSPAFNYRSSYIELVDLAERKVQNLTMNSVKETAKEDRI